MQALLPKLPPGADVVFRRLFDEENGCRLLLSLLNGILRFPPGARVRKLKVLSPHLSGPLADDKEVVLDLRAEAEDGRQFHIEIQVSRRPAYAERVLYYWAEMYAGQLEAGEGYEDLRAVISIHFLFFDLFDCARYPAHHHVFRARADGDGPVLSPQFEVHTLEMDKFPDLTVGDLESKWLYFLKYGHEMTAAEAADLGVPEIEEAERKLAMISQNRELRVQYEMRRKAERDALALTRDARAEGLREGRKEGLREGLDEGRKEGLKEGLKEGRKEGLDEGKRLGLDEGRRQGGLQAARNMLLGILGARGLAIPEAVRARIEAEQDLERLQEWGVRAARAENAEDIFAA